jgi:hypothetical protein
VVSETQDKANVKINVIIPWTKDIHEERKNCTSLSKHLDLLPFSEIARVMTVRGHPMSAALAFAICKKAQRKIKKALSS